MTDLRVDAAGDAASVVPGWRDQWRRWLTPRRVLTAIVVGQALWLGALLLRGWYSDADLARLADANRRPLNWHYLADAAGGHFAPSDRLLFWLMNRGTGVNWDATVVIRVALAVLATVLLRYLLALLVGPRWWLNLIVLCYAFSPLLVPGIAWLTSGANLVCSQVLIVLTLIAHVRYTRSGSWWAAISVGLCQALALGFQDQSILTIPILVLLSLGFLHRGTFRQRLAASLRRWGGWASLVVFVGGFLLVYEVGSYNKGSSSYGFSSAVRIAWEEWTDVLAPALVGGPWNWWWNPTTYVAYANPGAIVIVAGQLAFFLLFVLSLRATGRRAIVAWLIPVTVACGGVVLAGYGRYDVVKTFIPPLYRYSFTVPVALAVGVTLAFARTPDEGADERPHQDPEVPERARWVWRPATVRRALGVGVVAFLALSAWSSLRFDARFAQNRGQAYVDNLIASARAAGPNASVYDSAVSNLVIPFVEPRHYVSDILDLAGVHVQYDDATRDPLVVHPDGRLGPAVFVRTADATGLQVPQCGIHIGGKGTWRVPLSKQLGMQDWFLNLQTYQARPTKLFVTLEDAAGHAITPAGGPEVRLDHRLDSILLRLPVSAPATVILRSADPRATVCVVHTYLGGPLPAGS